MKYSDRLEIVSHHLTALLDELQHLKYAAVTEFKDIPTWIWPLERRLMDAAEFAELARERGRDEARS